MYEGKNYMKRFFILLLCLLVTNVCSLYAVCEGSADLKGIKWISVNSEQQTPNQWLCFRKVVYMDAQPDKVYMDIAVDSKYWLWVNEELVIFEGGLKRGPNPTDTYYDVVDLSKYLKRGKNIVSVLVWYWGKDGFCHKNSGMCGLLANIRWGKESVGTDSSWKVRVHPSFGESNEPKPNYRLPEYNVHFDARKGLGNWKKLNYDDSSWQQASVLGEYPCAPWNLLHKRPFPNWKDSGIVKYEKVEFEEKKDTVLITGTLPKNITVTPYICLKAEAGQLIDIRSDNYKGGSEYNVRAEYITKKGIQEFEMPNYINGHRVFYTLPKGVKCLKVGYRETRFNTEIIGKFACSDEFYNRLWEKSLNTMNLNMRDAIQDPDRERSQWWGDAAIILSEIFYSCDTNGGSAVRKAMLNLVDWQKEDGTLYSPVPAGSWDKELPLQMLAAIGKYGFWNYYQYTGDLHTIEYVYPKMKKYLSLWNIDERGLVKHRAGGWDWADWGDNIDVTVLDNAWYCLALESAIGMGKLLNDTSFVNYYTSQLELVRTSASNAFWTGEYFRSAGYKGITDDRANGMALLAGFADKSQWDKVCDFLMKRKGASPYMEKYIQEALLSKGYVKDALQRMKQRYTVMVESPLTTLWEDWTVGGAGGGSINHGWAGGALSLLPQYVAGVYPFTPGWDTIMVKPQLGDLSWIDCTVPVGNSRIEVQVTSNKSGYKIKVKNHTRKACLVGFPKNRIDAHLQVNKQRISIKNMQLSDNPYVKLTHSDDEYVYFQLKTDEVLISNDLFKK